MNFRTIILQTNSTSDEYIIYFVFHRFSDHLEIQGLSGTPGAIGPPGRDGIPGRNGMKSTRTLRYRFYYLEYRNILLRVGFKESKMSIHCINFGYKGPKGDDGYPGRPGITGAPGYSGIKGQKGEQGREGITHG